MDTCLCVKRRASRQQQADRVYTSRLVAGRVYISRLVAGRVYTSRLVGFTSAGMQGCTYKTPRFHRANTPWTTAVAYPGWVMS